MSNTKQASERTDIAKLPAVIEWRAANRAVAKAAKAIEEEEAKAAPIPKGPSPAAEREIMKQRLTLIPLQIALEEALLVRNRATVKARVVVDRAELAAGDDLAVRGCVGGLRDAYLAILAKEDRLQQELAAIAGEIDQCRVDAAQAWEELAKRRVAEDLPEPVTLPTPSYDGFAGKTPPREMVKRFESAMSASVLDERNHPCLLDIGRLKNEEKSILMTIAKNERAAKERAEAEAKHVSAADRARESAKRDQERWAAQLAEKRAEEERLAAEGRAVLLGKARL